MRLSIFERLACGALLATLLAGGCAGATGGPHGDVRAPAPSERAGNEPAAREPVPPERREVPFETIERRSVPGKAGEEVRAAVRDAAAWQRVWDDLAGGGGLAREAPAVDFEREMVLAAAMPTQGCVARVTIRGIAADAGGLVVDLLEQPPAEGVVCVVAERPFHAVRLARHDGAVRWEVERRPLNPGVR